VDYLTSPGHGNGSGWRKQVGLPRGGPSAVITDLGMMRFSSENGEAELASHHPGTSQDAITSETGWGLRIASDFRETPLPTEEEMYALEELDPRGFWLS
jgi:glutaconate CoA-transferase subunit B